MQRVTVTGHDENPVSEGLRLRGQGGDHVVGFETFLGHDRDAQRAENVLGDVDLALEFVRSLRSLRLVFGEQVGAKRLTRHVEGRGQVGGLLVTKKVDQHRREAVHRVGGLPTVCLEVLCGQRVEGAKRQRMPVEKHQERAIVRLAGGAGWSGGRAGPSCGCGAHGSSV